MKVQFISDFGKPVELVDDTGKCTFRIPRYGVWADRSAFDKRSTVIDTSDSLEELQEIYGPNLPVYPVPRANLE